MCCNFLTLMFNAKLLILVFELFLFFFIIVELANTHCKMIDFSSYSPILLPLYSLVYFLFVLFNHYRGSNFKT